MTSRRLPLLLVWLLAVFMLAAGSWCTLALWFRMPGPDMLRWATMASFVFLSSAALVALLKTRHLRPFLVFASLFVALLVWWHSLKPPIEAHWAPDVSQQVSGTFDGNVVTLVGVRDFEWTGPQEAKQNWITRSYDLDLLQGVDLFLSYWGNPNMAHFILSFDFGNGDHLAWSVEVRRTVDGSFSPIADLFRTNSLLIAAATERDVVGVRTNQRNEDVMLLPLATDPNRARKLFKRYVEDANVLAETPAWYNSITTNCTTVVLKMIEAAGGDIDFDWRLLVNGYLPEYLHEKRYVVNDIPVEELREISRISQMAKDFGLGEGFSEAIREGIPAPAAPIRP